MNQNNQQNTISILAFFMQRLFQSASLKRWFMVLLFLGGTATIEARQKPNMIVYLSDDLGYLDVSVYGASVVKTPILQQLSQEGMTFDNAFVASPSCAPSRAALLTGLMPAKNGAEVNHAFPAPDIPYLIGQLKDNGYSVFAFGKVAHYGGNEKCGFDFHHDEQVNLYENISGYFDSTKVEGPVCIFVGDRRPHVWWTEKMDYLPKEVDLPPYFIDTEPTREHRARYYTDVSGMDSEMGQVLDYFDNMLGSNTLTLFTSDHGAQWPFGKWNLYDAGIRTPLIVKWPTKIQAGSRTAAMVSWVDIMPTLLEASESAVPEGLDGKSFMEVLKGNTSTFRKEIFTTHTGDGNFNVYPMRSIRDERYKLIINLAPNAYHTNHSDILRKDGAGAFWDSWDAQAVQDPLAAAVVQHYFIRPAVEFYDLSNDPNEQHNLATNAAYQPRIAKMKAQLTEWMNAQGDEQKLYKQPYYFPGPKPNGETIKERQNEH
ncbi:sulfatase family protein [Echinicola vietnamensis]|uniref:Arylsulfatase A family protein n=1 Tax=Echinicola vietnamensis (strain DSM 17526 / LMG 23754 / KMM 6221) TaxID=926556 RepID=L0G589_ECHVK|nr:sulfatase [Echinicola vietnamensis]AGA79990.1 arylsulfatase A family protein [Echinicola vietnamensis DSM 17526]